MYGFKNILDFVVVVVFIASFLVGFEKGFAKYILPIVAFILAVIFVNILVDPILNNIIIPYVNPLIQSIIDSMDLTRVGSNSFILSLPDGLMKEILTWGNDTTVKIVGFFISNSSIRFLRFISFSLGFSLLIIIFNKLLGVTYMADHFPALNIFDRIAGGILASFLLIVKIWILYTCLYLLSKLGIKSMNEVINLLNTSYILHLIQSLNPILFVFSKWQKYWHFSLIVVHFSYNKNNKREKYEKNIFSNNASIITTDY